MQGALFLFFPRQQIRNRALDLYTLRRVSGGTLTICQDNMRFLGNRKRKGMRKLQVIVLRFSEISAESDHSLQQVFHHQICFPMGFGKWPLSYVLLIMVSLQFTPLFYIRGMSYYLTAIPAINEAMSSSRTSKKEGMYYYITVKD